MTIPQRGRDPVYRCPRGGFHKFGPRKMRWWIYGWFLGGGARFQKTNTRRCRKCGITYGPDGVVQTLD